MNLTALTGKVENIIIDAPAAVTDEIHSELDAAQREAEDRHPFRAMQAVYTANVPTGQERFAPATDWIRSREPRPTLENSESGTSTLDWIPTHEDFKRLYPPIELTSDFYGQPRHLWEDPEGDWIYVRPVPDDNGPIAVGPANLYGIEIPYIKRLALPSTNPSPETFFMDKAARYLIFKAASECLTLNRDHDEAQLYALKAEREFRRLQRIDNRRKLQGDTIGIRRDVRSTFNQRLR